MIQSTGPLDFGGIPEIPNPYDPSNPQRKKKDDAEGAGIVKMFFGVPPAAGGGGSQQDTGGNVDPTKLGAATSSAAPSMEQSMMDMMGQKFPETTQKVRDIAQSDTGQVMQTLFTQQPADQQAETFKRLFQ